MMAGRALEPYLTIIGTLTRLLAFLAVLATRLGGRHREMSPYALLVVWLVERRRRRQASTA
jgi:hypothetical protein